MTTNWIKLHCVPRLRYIKQEREAQLESRSRLEVCSPDLELKAAFINYMSCDGVVVIMLV